MSTRATRARAQARPHDRALAALLALLAAALLALLVTLTYGLSAEYGRLPGGPQPVDALVVLLLSGVAVLLLRGALGRTGAVRPSTAVLSLAVLAVFAVSASVSGALGGQVHDRRAASVGSACSPADREVLASVPIPGLRDGPHGDPEGGCVLHLFPRANAAVAAPELAAALERDGWSRAAPRGDELTLERDGAVLTLTAESDDKATEVVLTLQ